MNPMKPLSLEYEFSSADHGSPEERATTATLRILVEDEVATRIDDSWAKSVREWIRVGCYPLATWIAGSWWRLFYEAPLPQAHQRLDWRMAHELAASGSGYLWPRLTFLPDGEALEVKCRPSPRVPAEPLGFLSSFRKTIPRDEAERELAQFVSSVVARLDALGLTETELHAVWADLQHERSDMELARFRELEAELGFDPDEGPESLVVSLRALEPSAGKSAVVEVASAAGVARASREPLEFVRAVTELSRSAGLPAVFDQNLRALANGASGRPWERGRLLAGRVRSALGIPRGAIDDGVLKQVLGADFTRPTARAPIGLAVRTGEGRAAIHFRRSNSTGRRFEAARLVGEELLAPREDSWLAITDAGTARQKAQRAFAAEFLVPIAELEMNLRGDFSQEALEAAAEEYVVSPLLISSHLANNGFLDSDDVKAASQRRPE